MKAMIFAAGLGTRLRPITNEIPKALVKVRGIPIIEHLIKRLKFFGFNHIIVNVHHFASKIIEFLNSKKNFDIDIAISYEDNELLDTGGGLYNARWFFNSEPFLVHNVDIFSNINILDIYRSHLDSGSLVTLAVREGYIDRALFINSGKRICGWKDLKASYTRISYSDNNLYLVNFCGIHVISPDIFKLVKERNAFSIIDLYLRLAKDYIIKGYYCNDAWCIDIGTHNNLSEAEGYLY